MSESAARVRGSVDPRALSYYDVDLDTALAIARERIEEWDYGADPHGYCHERPVLMRLVQTVEDARQELVILALDAVVICGMAVVVGWAIVIGDALGAAGASLLLGLMLSGSATRLGRYLRGR